MSWRNAAILLLALLVAGCGLRPLHMAPRGDAIHAELAAIEIDAPRSRLGSELADQLRSDLNPAGLTVDSRYRLDITLQLTRTSLAIQLDDRVTRYDLSLAAFFSLSDRSNDRTIYRSAVRRVASYNVQRDPFATLAAEQDAERRAAVEVSHQIRTLLALKMADNSP
ncbi:MAG: hypothetical protein H6851_08605 [Geminicoccaceae bacterium]|nr:hypothetical protein [Geminicoccaceae bacterium]MCB9943661.1 hypothetical protein [Geminicoccaceae bacterium]